jgi:hypothetical protein
VRVCVCVCVCVPLVEEWAAVSAAVLALAASELETASETASTAMHSCD